jgi:hypothetical protein
VRQIRSVQGLAADGSIAVLTTKNAKQVWQCKTTTNQAGSFSFRAFAGETLRGSIHHCVPSNFFVIFALLTFGIFACRANFFRNW